MPNPTPSDGAVTPRAMPGQRVAAGGLSGRGRALALVAGLSGIALLAACGQEPIAPLGAEQAARRAATAPARDGFSPVYLDVATRLMDTNLVNFQVRMRGARYAGDVEDYARCAAGQYTLIRGYEYAQHVRTNLAKDGGIWKADAVYTVSPSFPAGSVALRASEVVKDCRDKGIPTV